jgi:hypothetical protein
MGATEPVGLERTKGEKNDCIAAQFQPQPHRVSPQADQLGIVGERSVGRRPCRSPRPGQRPGKLGQSGAHSRPNGPIVHRTVGPLGRKAISVALAPQGVALGWENGAPSGQVEGCQEILSHQIGYSIREIVGGGSLLGWRCNCHLNAAENRSTLAFPPSALDLPPFSCPIPSVRPLR